MNRIGLHHAIRISKGVFKDGVLGVNYKRCDFVWTFYKRPLCDLVRATAARYVRRYMKKATVYDWNTLTELISREFSGNPIQTHKGVRIETRRWRGGHKPIVIKGSGRNCYAELAIDEWRACERLERLREYKRKKEELLRIKYAGKLQCSVCGEWGEADRYKGVKYRVYRFNPNLLAARILNEGRKLGGPTCLKCYTRLRRLLLEYQESVEIRKLASELSRRLKSEN